MIELRSEKGRGKDVRQWKEDDEWDGRGGVRKDEARGGTHLVFAV